MDGMDENTPPLPAAIATEVTRALDALNRATQTSHVDGWQVPSDAYGVITSLAIGGHSLIQTLEQVSRLLYDLNGKIVSLDGTLQTEHQLIGARGALRRARTDAERMEAALREALIYISGLTTNSNEPPAVTPRQ